MKCITSGTMQAYIDGELDITMKKEVQKHLETCERCGKEYEQLKKTDDFVYGKLTAYKEYCGENYIPAGKTWTGGKAKNETEQEPSGKSKKRWPVLKLNKAMTAACIVVVLTLCIAIQPVRAFISEALNIFRVENVKSLQISYSDMEEIRMLLEQKEGEVDLENFGKITTEGFSVQELTLEKASSTRAPALLLPPGADEGNIEIQLTQPGIVAFTMNVGNVNAALKSLGSDKLLPDRLDGKTFTAHFAAQAEYLYHEGESFIFVMQAQAPELAVPAEVNVDELYECLAELPILPEDMKRQIRTIQDWKNTIYLPVLGEPQEITLRGSQGFISEKRDKGWMLVWYENGTIFSAEGNTGKEDLIQFAESLR